MLETRRPSPSSSKELSATKTLLKSWPLINRQVIFNSGCHRPSYVGTVVSTNASKHLTMCVRPFQDVPAQQRQALREQQWHGRWGIIDKPIESAERERLRGEGIVQARSWEDLDPHEVMKKLKKLPQKACGPDGISYALLKNLPIEGVIELCHMKRKWVCTTLVLLLPKKADIERPISLTSVMYRTWCRLRWDKLRPWQTSIGQRLPWERSLPGTQVL